MLSVGLDRRVCEYDLENSTVEIGFLCQSRTGNEEIKVPRRDSVKSNNNKYTSYDTNEEKFDHTQISKTDITGKPTAIMWHPRMCVTDIEEKFFTANTEYKLKEFNAHSKECRKTTLAPVFSDKKNANFFNNTNTLTSAHRCQNDFFYNFISGAPNQLIPIRINGWVTHYAYSCPENIIGVGSFPLTGNPTQVFISSSCLLLHPFFVLFAAYLCKSLCSRCTSHIMPFPLKVMGISAHAGAVSAISVSFDGKYLFSAGRGDQSSYMYELCLSNGNDSGISNISCNGTSIERCDLQGESTETARALGVSAAKEVLGPFLSLLDGGEGGDLHEDIIDYFYYCQLRAQGEDSMEARAISGRIPVEEIPALMRAVGFYPSEAQAVDMLNEVHMTYIHVSFPSLVGLLLLPSRDVYYLLDVTSFDSTNIVPGPLREVYRDRPD